MVIPILCKTFLRISVTVSYPLGSLVLVFLVFSLASGSCITGISPGAHGMDITAQPKYTTS